MNNTYLSIYNNFHPELITIQNWDSLASAFSRTSFLIYGEAHGIRENANIIYTYCKNLNIRHLAIECAPSTKPFINSLVRNEIDFTLIDPDIFNASPLSIEMAKTITTLFHENILKNVHCIDTYADSPKSDEDSDSPQQREVMLTNALLDITRTAPALCITSNGTP